MRYNEFDIGAHWTLIESVLYEDKMYCTKTNQATNSIW